MKSVEEMIWKLGSSNYGLISNGYPYPEFAQVMYCRGISAYWTFVCFRDFVFDKPCAPWFDGNKRIGFIDECVAWVRMQKEAEHV